MFRIAIFACKPLYYCEFEDRLRQWKQSAYFGIRWHENPVFQIRLSFLKSHIRNEVYRVRGQYSQSLGLDLFDFVVEKGLFCSD
jgi:hypothetical protein